MSRSARSLGRKLNYSFTHEQLMQQALTHRSAGKNNNERLEFLGDSVLNLVISGDLYDRFPRQDEGQLSRLRASLVKGETLAEIAGHIGLGDYLVLGTGELKSGGARRESILAGALEALIGAVFLDAGFDTARDFVMHLFGERCAALSAEQMKKDPKTQLQEYLQSTGQPLPLYEITDVKGQPHDQAFFVSCHIAQLDHPVLGKGGSRRKAEQDAAVRALYALHQNDSSDDAEKPHQHRRQR